MFGISFTEISVIAVMALLVVGPHKLPQMLGTLGKWAGKLRRITSEMRHQTGIDELLRNEGLHGGLSELRGLMRGPSLGAIAGNRAVAPRPQEPTEFDRLQEYPVEGVDCSNAIADDLIDASEDGDDDDEGQDNPTASASASEDPYQNAEAEPKPADESKKASTPGSSPGSPLDAISPRLPEPATEPERSAAESPHPLRKPSA